MARNSKYSKRYYKKRYKKINNKYKFSKYNTFKNRSSTDQANQIYSLNKKLNGYIKKTRPETQTKEFNAVTIDDSGYGSASYTTIVNQPTDAKMWCITPPSVYTTFSGKLSRVIGYSIRGFVSTNYSATFPSTLRLILFSNKAERTGAPLMTEIINYAAGDITDYERGPLKTGVTANYKILYDRSIIMSPSFYRSKTFGFKLRKFKNFRSSTAFTNIGISPAPIIEQIYPAGTIFCIALFINHGYASGSTSAYPAMTLKDFRVKLSYVDQN